MWLSNGAAVLHAAHSLYLKLAVKLVLLLFQSSHQDDAVHLLQALGTQQRHMGVQHKAAGWSVQTQQPVWLSWAVVSRLVRQPA